MPTNFRLAYNSDGLNYTDLFPKTSAESILGADNIYELLELQVDIPVPTSSTLTQNVAITTTDKMLNSAFRVYLLTEGEQAEKDYATISQIEIQENQLVITRLYNMPTSAITVSLVFFEYRGEVNA